MTQFDGWPEAALRAFYNHTENAIAERLLLCGGLKTIENYTGAYAEGRGLKRRILFKDGTIVNVAAELRWDATDGVVKFIKEVEYDALAERLRQSAKADSKGVRSRPGSSSREKP